MMSNLNKVSKIAGWITFAITFLIYAMTAESTGSLWDCGEFITAAYKLEVVHPPGASFFMLVGRLFTWIAEMVSSDPTAIAFSVNLMSAFCGGLTAMFAAWITMMFAKIMLKGKTETTTSAENTVIVFSGMVAGLTTAFCTSVWFSAVEGEVYAMSTLFTSMTFWAAMKWYSLPNDIQSDRWIVLSAYFAGLSIGVHLLSILAFPAIALLYYFKKNEKHTFLGMVLSLLIGAGAIIFVMKPIIVGITSLWLTMEIFTVNSLGMPIHSGLIPTILLLFAVIGLLLYYAHKNAKYYIQLFTVSCVMVMIGFSTLGIIVIRANADTPINMNVPSDATRLLPYLNREQYGERPLLFGVNYTSDPIDVKKTPRYGLKNGKYEYITEKYDYEYNKKDLMFFPRTGHSDRKELHEYWRTYLNGGKKPKGKPGVAYNLSFFWNYQIQWMYVRYFMWNFVGKQNGEQGYFPWNLRDGNWESGIPLVDNLRLYDDSIQPATMKDQAQNHYFFIPLLLGLLGLFFHARRSKKEFMALMILFLITGIGIILYSNQPPNEPRERDYVLAGSFMAFSFWVGLSVVALYGLLKDKIKGLSLPNAAVAAGVLALSAPIIMSFQNYDDHNRSGHYGARDYAANILESCEPNSIIFTYGDNDTYPVWYAQEVEGIRRDVRVVNLSLIQVDWYIDKLRSRVNDSAPIKLSIPQKFYEGKTNNQVFFFNGRNSTDKPTNIFTEFSYNQSPKSIVQGNNTMRTKHFYIPIDKSRAIANGVVEAGDTTLVDRIDIKFKKSKNYIQKDELAILDIIASNIHDRPVYFAVTCKNEKLLGLNDYMQMEGLSLRMVPAKTKSDKSFFIYGSGRVDTQKSYDNIMKKWEWGNFDKEKHYISKSYAAEIQAMKMTMVRTATSLERLGEKEKAADIAMKYFEGFPHFNFPYDATVISFIDVLVRTEKQEEAKKHIQILGDDCYERMQFFDTLNDKQFSSFEDDLTMTLRSINDLFKILDRINDNNFAKGMKAKLEQFDPRKMNLKR